jgi:hypothetical protein
VRSIPNCESEHHVSENPLRSQSKDSEKTAKDSYFAGQHPLKLLDRISLSLGTDALERNPGVQAIVLPGGPQQFDHTSGILVVHLRQTRIDGIETDRTGALRGRKVDKISRYRHDGSYAASQPVWRPPSFQRCLAFSPAEQLAI